MRLLIVDDHDINLRLLRAQLEGENIEVVEAVDGVDALALLEAGGIDGVVSDILMPRMDGYRLCMEVRARADLVHLPFVLYTSTYNSASDRELAASVGADAYVSKPAPTARILEALNDAARRRRDGGAPAPAMVEPAPLMRQYNEALIRKLEEKGLELERAHEGLLESQARLSGLVASAMDAIIAVDEARTILLFNAAAGRMFRIAPEAALGRSLNDFIPMRSRDAHDAHMARFAAEGESARPMGPREVNGLRADGTEFPIEANISRMETSRGPLYTVFIRDVTERRRAQAALRESEAGLRRAQELAGMAHATVNARGAVVSRSESFASLLGLDPAHLPRTQAEFVALVHEDDRDALLDAARATRAHRRRIDLEYRLRRGGEWRQIRHIIEGLDDPSDPEGGLTFNTLQDVTEAHQDQQRIRQLNHVYAVLSAINGLIVRVGDRDELMSQACRILVDTGRFAKAWIGLVDEGVAPIRILAWAGAEDAFFEDLERRLQHASPDHPGLIASVLAGQGPAVANDIANDPRVSQRDTLVASGSRSFALFPLVIDGRTIGVVSIHAPFAGFFDAQETSLLLGLAQDISFALDHLIKSDRISYLANHDVLTGLPNRALYSELLTQKLAEPNSGNLLGCTALLDLARFRHINDTLGRAAGDTLLEQVGARLKAFDPFVARLGGDVFALQFHERRSAAELARDFELLSARCFGQPFHVAGVELRMGCRIGAAVFPDDGRDAEALLRNAESALRRARAAAEPFVFYAPAMNASANQALALESRLRRAVEREEFVLHYQPKLRLADRRIVGAEALIRWQDPDHGLVAPNHFIPVLEDTGLIGVVGQWALRRALEDARHWRQAGTALIRVAVNVSPLQLNQPSFPDQVSALLREHVADCLEIELTESVLMADVEHKVAMLERIRDLGVTIAVDDFGTGYSSLAYIARLPIHSLKIDRAFVNGMADGPEGRAIVASIIALAHALRLKVVAEGIETEAQAQLLHQLACEEGQGYHFSRPVPSDKLLALLLDQEPPASPAD